MLPLRDLAQERFHAGAAPALQDAIDKGQRDRARMEASAASGRMVMPQEVAMAAAFLLSDEASAITGINLPVDHGWLVANSWASFGGLRHCDG
jgi:NAD(P)-dependent dehydrogenase (short-subunit alcohol dehydrogenase family)